MDWTPTRIISDPETPFLTLVAVDDVDTPTQELRCRLDAAVVSTRDL